MKGPLVSVVSLGLLVSAGLAEEKGGKMTHENGYVSQASLPEGWPMPGPFHQVTPKTYPVYRAAYTSGSGQTRSFWALFNHIKREKIPMTAPVEMEVQSVNGELEMTTMGFLYQSPEVGEQGLAGEKVRVMDVPAMRVLSYAWIGPNNEDNQLIAKKALDSALAAESEAAIGFRILGYNGPSVPKAKRTHEMQAILPK